MERPSTDDVKEATDGGDEGLLSFMILSAANAMSAKEVWVRAASLAL